MEHHSAVSVGVLSLFRSVRVHRFLDQVLIIIESIIEQGPMFLDFIQIALGMLDLVCFRLGPKLLDI